MSDVVGSQPSQPSWPQAPRARFDSNLKVVTGEILGVLYT